MANLIYKAGLPAVTAVRTAGSLNAITTVATAVQPAGRVYPSVPAVTGIHTIIGGANSSNGTVVTKAATSKNTPQS